MAVGRNEHAVETRLSQDGPLDVNSDVGGKHAQVKWVDVLLEEREDRLGLGTQLAVVACYQALCYHLQVKVELQCDPLGDLRSLGYSAVGCTCHARRLLRDALLGQRWQRVWGHGIDSSAILGQGTGQCQRKVLWNLDFRLDGRSILGLLRDVNLVPGREDLDQCGRVIGKGSFQRCRQVCHQ